MGMAGAGGYAVAMPSRKDKIAVHCIQKFWEFGSRRADFEDGRNPAQVFGERI